MRSKVITIVLLLVVAILSQLFFVVSAEFIIPAPELNYSEFDTIYERFVIYNNRIYKQYVTLRDYPNFTDEYIGTINKDDAVYKWNDNDYFIEFGGNVPGNYYAVKGYSSKYVICLREENGDLVVFISPYNTAINHGADVYEKMYNFTSNVSCVYYNMNINGTDNACPINEEIILLEVDVHNEITEFLNELNLLKFNEIDLNSSLTFDSFCILNVQSKNGMKFQLSLCEDGYILGALPYYYQKMDEGKFYKFVDFLISMQSEENKAETNDNNWNSISEIYEDEFISPYIPQYLPGGFSLSAFNSNAVYSYNTESGKRNGVQEAYINLNAGSYKYFCLEINDYKEQFSRDDAPYVTLDMINIEFIENNIRTETDYSNLNTKGKTWFSCVVIYDNAAVKYTAIGMSSEEIYKILSSINLNG